MTLANTSLTSPIRIAIAGIGNCASALVQGIAYYSALPDAAAEGIMHPEIGGWRCRDILVAAAFDVDRRKVGRQLGEAILAAPNCARVFTSAALLPVAPVVLMGPILDGVAAHMSDHPEEHAFRVSAAPPVDVAAVLRQERVDALVSYMPVGSDKATSHYAQACLEAGCAMVNCTPSFIASDPSWAERFEQAGLPIIGDDIKSQVGATIVHRALARLFEDRGVKLVHTYQLNVGGNTDFLNMLARDRLVSKKVSKTNAVQSQLNIPLAADDIMIGPSDYVPWQKDGKVAFIRLEAEGFGGAPIELELRLSVQDSPNSAGVVIDAIRYAALARRLGRAGPIEEVCSWLMKSPPRQLRDEEARQRVEALIEAARRSGGGTG